MRTRGISLIEISLALFLVFVATMVFLSIFSSSSQQSLQSRNRTVAIVLANSLMDELEAHPFGAPEPPSWQQTLDQPVKVWLQGRHQEMDFHKLLTFLNGSCIGKTQGDSDVVTITISWHEGQGNTQAGAVVPTDNKILVVQMPVWR